MKITDLQVGLRMVREQYPGAMMEGSTFDWSYVWHGKLVAEATTNRRSRKREWELTIHIPPKTL